MVKNPPQNAGDSDLIPGQETGILHASGQLSQCAAIREANMPEHMPQLSQMQSNK